MTRRTRTTRARLHVDSLEGRIVPASFFKIDSLTGNNSFTEEVNFATGDDHGGIATTSNSVLLTGDSQTARFNLSDLGSPVGVGSLWEGLTSDLATQTAYVLATSPSTPDLPYSSATVTDLIALDSTTGALTGASVHLSNSINVGYLTGIFAGYGRIVIHPSSGPVYEVALPSGTVTQLNPLLPEPIHADSESLGYYGTAEHFGGEDYLDYVQDSFNIVRQKVSDGSISTIATFGYLADMASFTVSPSNGRWYFHHENPSQFIGSVDEALGYADATFEYADFIVTNNNDSGAGSLRDAVKLANLTLGTNSIAFDPTVTGDIVLTSGDITVSESLNIFGPGSGVVNVIGDASDRILADGSGGTLALTVAGLRLTNPAGFDFPYAVRSNGDFVVDAGAGDISFDNDLNVAVGTTTLVDSNGVAFGPTITMNGGTLDAGTMTVTSGETLQGFGTITGDVNVGPGAVMTLTGGIDGSVDAEGGAVVSPAGAAPGFLSVGSNFTLGSGAALTVELNGGPSDQIAVGGSVHLGTNPLNFVATLGFVPSPGNFFTVIDNQGGAAVTGGLAAVGNRGGMDIGGLLFQFQYDGGDGNDVVLVTNSSPQLAANVTTNLAPILEDTPAATNLGTDVKSLVETGGLYIDPQGFRRSGIAITGVDSANGIWQWTTDGGVDWNSIASASPTSAVLLEGDNLGEQRVRFLPNANFFGTATIALRGWDVTNALAAGNIGQDATGGGYNSAYSAEEVIATLHVLSVNDPPDAVNDTAGAIVEDAGAQPIDVLFNDSTGPDPNEMLKISSVTQGAHGAVVITGGGTGLTYQPDANFNGTDSFLYSISDGNGGSDFATVTVTVANDAADRLEVVTSPGTIGFTEGGASVKVDAGVVLGTADEGTITGATVKISSGYVPKKDVLSFTPGVGSFIKAKFDPKKGVLTLTGAAAVADYQAALRNVEFSNLSPAPVAGQRKIDIQVQDAGGLGDPGTKLLNVTAVNSKAVVTLPTTPVKYKLGKAGAGVLAGIKVTDVDNTRLQSAKLTISGLVVGDVLAAVTAKTPLMASFVGGVLTLTGNADLKTYLKVLKSIKFTATAAGGGSRTLTLTVNDGLADSDPVTRTVSVA